MAQAAEGRGQTNSLVGGNAAGPVDDSTAVADGGEPTASGPSINETDGQGDIDGSGPDLAKAADMSLESLSPRYDEDSHATYLRRLEEAVSDPKNLNIALTGRYGAGKSSVLDKFEAKNSKAVLRLSISTLARGEEGESTTNLIQKDIVRQLLYGASEKVGKNSRFNKIAVLSWPTAFIQSAAVVLPLGAVAYIAGALPRLKWTGAAEPDVVQVAVWVSAAVLVTGLATVVRLVTHGRFNVSDVSAGGAALTLTEKPQTFFDKYTDEIVHYFARESRDLVIFEDLDRFDDPQIFEELRKLNVLLNGTPERRKKRAGTRTGRLFARLLGKMKRDWPDQLAVWLPYPWGDRLLGRGEPVRFIYAVRDSLFSKLDADRAPANVTQSPVPDVQDGEDVKPAAAPGVLDEAAAETRRANRTKFFDIVIPLVPFISHRNARDLLTNLLDERRITGIEPRVVNTIARHCTDMRLMRNMCNEYLLFAERLLEPMAPRKKAPGLTASRLFALVAYKNFHLEDFENITRRDSDLDRLYEFAHRVVRDNIAKEDDRKRLLSREPERVRTHEQVAVLLGKRLGRYAEKLQAGSAVNPWPVLRFAVGSTSFALDEIGGYEFWAAVATGRSLTISVTPSANHSQTQVIDQLDDEALGSFAPESLDAARWASFDEGEVLRQLGRIEVSIELLRRAGFVELVQAPQFVLTMTDDDVVFLKDRPAAPSLGQAQSFAQLVTVTLKSELARELVRRGFIDRNFSLYAAQFYGNFSGVDVANFMIQHVQPNVMNIDYDLSRPKRGDREGAVANLLAETEEAGEDLLETVAAWNLNIVDHLLVSDTRGASIVARQLISEWPGEQASEFLGTYFTAEHTQREKFAALLARIRWQSVYTYLVDDDVPTTARTKLLDAALAEFDPEATYDFDDTVREHITSNYRDMPVFAGVKADPTAKNAAPSSAVGDAQHTPADQVASPHPSRLTDGLPERLERFLADADIVIPDLAPLMDDVRTRVIASGRYQVNSNNLRIALSLADVAPVPLEAVHSDRVVYDHCLANFSTYLGTVDNDTHTLSAVTTPAMLVQVLDDLIADLADDHSVDPGAGDVAELLKRASTTARVPNLHDAPASMWTALAAANLFRASLVNVQTYLAAHGDTIDEHLAHLLGSAGRVYVDEDGDTAEEAAWEDDLKRPLTAVAILNASVLPTRVRVDLVRSLEPVTPLGVDSIVVEPNDLFALLLMSDLVADDEVTFARLRDGGWAALGPAIKVSDGVGSFMCPSILIGMVGAALSDSETADKVEGEVLGDVNGYVPEDDWPELRAVAMYADKHSAALDPASTVRIARVGDGHSDLDVAMVLRLLSAASPAADASQIVEAFEHLGAPYSRITSTGDSFDLAADHAHDRLLKVLQSENRISRGYPRVPKRRYSVTVT